MTILAINTLTTGLIGQQTKPHRCTMITTDDFATITAPGYLNGENKFGVPIDQTDLFDILYSFDQQTQQGTYGKFVVAYQNGNFILLNAAQTDIGIPTLAGQTLLNINGNGQSPLYTLDLVTNFINAPNGIMFVNEDPSAGVTLFGTIGNQAAGVVAAASTQAAILACAFIDQYPNTTLKTVFDRGVFSYTEMFDGVQRNDGNITPLVKYGNLTYNGVSTDSTADVEYLPSVLNVIYNQPASFTVANKYDEAADANSGLATLVAGTVTVANTSITANSRIQLTIQDPNGGTPGAVYVSSKTAGVGFDITSTSGADTSIVHYIINEKI